MSIFKKLNTARSELRKIKLKKSGFNKFSNYDYFELSDFIPHVMNIFNDVGLCGVVSYDKEIATLTIIDIDDATQRIVITSPMAAANLKGCHEIQNLGAVETYQRRYLWVTAMEILENDIVDSSAGTTPKEQDKPAKKTITPDNKPLWERAKSAYKRDGNLVKVLASMNISQEHQTLLMEECENEAVVS